MGNNCYYEPESNHETFYESFFTAVSMSHFRFASQRYQTIIETEGLEIYNFYMVQSSWWRLLVKQ